MALLSPGTTPDRAEHDRRATLAHRPERVMLYA
jgi:hypothetical protein